MRYQLKNPFRFVSPRNRILRRGEHVAAAVEELKEQYRALSDDQLKAKTAEFIGLLQKGQSLNDILIDALATIREAAFRELGQFAYPVQLIGAYIVYQGDFAEMMTGEGKTLTLFLASYVCALEKQGVHVVTVNEYLASRDAETAGRIFARLDMTVGCNRANLAPAHKKAAFACDVTYTTNSELGFDYLRDNMVEHYEDKKIRGLHFAIIDEGDSVLIDEARTPLIISGQPKKDLSLYFAADKFVSTLNDNDYKIDPETRSPTLTESGMKKAEAFFKLQNLFDIENSDTFHKITNALTANKVFENGKEYIVRDNKILIVDHFTGRVLEGRSYNSGLHQAVQAKERVPIEPENVIVATITYQSFFRMYKKLAAVSGTALTEAEEFLKIYNMVVVPIPTNRRVIRQDWPDYVFGNHKMKWEAVVADIEEHHAKGQPILVGTASVEDSEILHQKLNEANIPHEVLNAKNHAREAEIVARAGQRGAVTISTNMAGRGTDIKLGEGIIELGGLYVIGTERHESRRIDNQLRGRSGRQGDAGESRFFISFGDSLFKRFAADKIDKLIMRLGDDAFDSKMFTRILNRTQKKVESVNFDTRKNLIDYDHVLSNQRELIYKQRDKVLLATELSGIIARMQDSFVSQLVRRCRDAKNQNLVNYNVLSDVMNKQLLGAEATTPADFENLTIPAATDKANQLVSDLIDQKRKAMTPAIALRVFRSIIVQRMDELWIQHLDKMMKLREGVSLRSMEQVSPLNIYVKEADTLFNAMLANIAEKTIGTICALSVPSQLLAPEQDAAIDQQRAEALARLEQIKQQNAAKQNMVAQFATAIEARRQQALNQQPTANQPTTNQVVPTQQQPTKPVVPTAPLKTRPVSATQPFRTKIVPIKLNKPKEASTKPVTPAK